MHKLFNEPDFKVWLTDIPQVYGIKWFTIIAVVNIVA